MLLRFTPIIRAVDDLILIDAAGNVLMFNPACEKLFKYGSDEVIGRSVKMLMPGHYAKSTIIASIIPPVLENGGSLALTAYAFADWHL
jgi:PAS domain-containing protein